VRTRRCSYHTRHRVAMPVGTKLSHVPFCRGSGAARGLRLPVAPRDLHIQECDQAFGEGGFPTCYRSRGTTSCGCLYSTIAETDARTSTSAVVNGCYGGCVEDRLGSGDPVAWNEKFGSPRFSKRKAGIEIQLRCRTVGRGLVENPFATIASCISIASACASFAIYFDLIPHTLHIGSIVNSSAEYELS
jgi:hypothetical protein